MIRCRLAALRFALPSLIPLLLFGSRLDAQASSVTLHFSESRVQPANNPCYGRILGELTYDATLHITENDMGVHSVIAMHGTATATPANPGIAPFSGGFNEVQVLNEDPRHTTSTIVVTQRQLDGLAFHITFQIGVDASGVIQLVVLNYACG
jgi:hypothetical protein